MNQAKIDEWYENRTAEEIEIEPYYATDLTILKQNPNLVSIVNDVLCQINDLEAFYSESEESKS